MKLAVLIDCYMKQNQISQRSLASEIGIDHCTIRNILIGKTLNGESLYKILLWLMKPDSYYEERKKTEV